MDAAEVCDILAKRTQKGRVSLSRWLVYAGMFALSYWIFYALLLRSGSDLSIHATWAAEGDFLQPRTFFRHGAHPLWHMLVAAVMLAGVPLKIAAALVTAGLKVAEVWLFIRLLDFYLHEELPEKAITGAAVVCTVVTSLWVPWINPTVYYGVGSPNLWHSPTQMIAMVAMLLCVPYTAACYAEFERLVPEKKENAMISWRKIVTLGLGLLISLSAKPTFMQAFLPAACLYFLAQWIRHPRNSRFFWQMIAAALPAVLLMILQYMYYFGIIVPSQGSMTLEISAGKLGQVLLATLLIQAFPLYALVTCAKRADFRNPFLALCLLMDGVGILEFLLLGESGRRAADGNFGWGMMGAALMLWIPAMVLFLRSFALARKKGRKTLRYQGGFALLAWHIGSGVYYIFYLLTGTGNL